MMSYTTRVASIKASQAGNLGTGASLSSSHPSTGDIMTKRSTVHLLEIMTHSDYFIPPNITLLFVSEANGIPQ